MAEQRSSGSPIQTSKPEPTTLIEVIDEKMMVDRMEHDEQQHLPPVNGINGHHAEPDPLPTLASISPTSTSVAIPMGRPRDSIVEDEDQPPPAKRARKMSDADREEE